VGGAPSVGTLKVMFRKDMASLSMGAPLEPRGTWNLEGSHTSGTLKDGGL